MTGRVEFRENMCKGCALCASVCPKNIIILDNNRTNSSGYNPAMVTNMDECIGCGNCAMMCPDSVITVERFRKEA